MPTDADDPSEEDVLFEAIRAELAKVHTSIPARVLAWDPLRQVVTVQPVVLSRHRDPVLDLTIPAPIPPIANVPVVFPGGGQAGTVTAITFPLFPGDWVWLAIGERGLDEWKATGADGSFPQDPRRWDYTDAVAFPGIRATPGLLPALAIDPVATVVYGPQVKLGSAAATDFVALATLVLARLTALHTHALTHVHGGPGTPAAPTVPPLPPVPAPVAAVKVRAE